ncbi:hypothetical protein LTR85_003925 [Meristemomyces frigidus]|nr:hypothetical protein LTR85_003925 [Meristemomyces frigidus]
MAEDNPIWETLYPLIAASFSEPKPTAAEVKARYEKLRRQRDETLDFHRITDGQPDTTPR